MFKIKRKKEEKEIQQIQLILSNRFKNYINNIISINNINNEYDAISDNLRYLNNKYLDVSFIDITDKEDTISFISNEQILKCFNRISKGETLNQFISSEKEIESFDLMKIIANYKGVWNIARNEMKIGKFVKRLYPECTDIIIENFVNKYKSLYNIRKEPKFEIVTGADIAKYYDSTNYAYCEINKEGFGQLGKSCMRYGKPFLSLYEKNTNVCSLLIMKSNEHPDKIMGRALIWKLSDGSTYMDRIYTHFDSDIYIFRTYAKERNWLSHYEEIRNMIHVKDMKINLEESDFRYYPYMDSFGYINIEAKTLSTKIYDSIGSFYELKATDGRKEKIR